MSTYFGPGMISGVANAGVQVVMTTKVIQVDDIYRCTLTIDKKNYEYLLYLSDSSGVGFTDANLPDFVKRALAILGARNELHHDPDVYIPFEDNIGIRVNDTEYILVVTKENLEELKCYPIHHIVPKFTVKQLQEAFQQKMYAGNVATGYSQTNSQQNALWGTTTTTSTTAQMNNVYLNQQNAISNLASAANAIPQLYQSYQNNTLAGLATPTAPAPATITSWVKTKLFTPKKASSKSLVERYKKPG